MNFGESSSRLDQKLSQFIDDDDRGRIWTSASNILDKADLGMTTVMGLGYVQSGKTTSISALCALASDRGYRLIIALLGTTNLLTDQNRSRVEETLGVDDRNYIWHSVHQLNTKSSPGEVSDFLSRGRTIILPIIKNTSVIRKAAAILENCALASVRTLIIDDEADQASLNTKVSKNDESSTFSAIQQLRAAVGGHLYVQYTATPYAPILLDDDSPLMPQSVEFLTPGKGYVGGREFFFTHANTVLRTIPETDEQTTKTRLSSLPESLVSAMAAYLVGATHLWHADRENAPVSMLVHSSYKNIVQEQYEFLIKSFVANLKHSDILSTQSPFLSKIDSERSRLHALGIAPMNDDEFHSTLNFVVRELTLWLVNSASEVKAIKWNSSPFHLLIGGNKLDRGFTVEGLTVSYMNRPPSKQIDTLEQRARAFGYREALLPYCLFFATAKSMRFLRGIVITEDDLRISLKDSLESGQSVASWSREIGLLLPANSVASRSNVLPLLRNFSPDGTWISLRQVELEQSAVDVNYSLIAKTGLLESEESQFGRLSMKTKQISARDLADLLKRWIYAPSTPGWPAEDVANLVSRTPSGLCTMVLLDNPESPQKPRIRAWDSDTGFTNLFQGRDLKLTQDPDQNYLGDRQLHEYLPSDRQDTVILQVHRVTRRGFNDRNLLTLAIRIPEHGITRKGTVYEQ